MRRYNSLLAGLVLTRAVQQPSKPYYRIPPNVCRIYYRGEECPYSRCKFRHIRPDEEEGEAIRTAHHAALLPDGAGCPAASMGHLEPLGESGTAVEETRDEQEACVELRYPSIVN